MSEQARGDRRGLSLFRWAEVVRGGMILCGAIATSALAVDIPSPGNLRLGGPTDVPSQARAELDRLKVIVPRFEVVSLPKGGDVVIAADQSLTVTDLQGAVLDEAAPRMAGSFAWPIHMRDDLGGGAPYIAQGIQPFRLRYFTAEFNYTGWYNYQMLEYAGTHGFSVLPAYVFKTDEKKVFPAGTTWLKWGSFFDWKAFFDANKLPWGRWDKLAEFDARSKILASGVGWPAEPDSIAMIDIEQATPLSPDQLRGQSWYPKSGTDAERAAFESKYYAGFTLHHTILVDAARAKGWKSVGVYPQLFSRGWFEIISNPKEEKDPAADWRWTLMGASAVPAQDVLYPDNYLYYWDARNVGYVLAHQDYMQKAVKTLDSEKQRPIRPYLWPLLHGGDTAYHWWNQMALPDEDQRALSVFSLFTGNDGVVLWNWSGTCNHHLHRPIAATEVCRDYGGRGVNSDVQVGKEFQWTAIGKSSPTVFRRYDVVLVTSFDGVNVTFKHVPTGGGAGTNLNRSNIPDVFVMPKDKLAGYLRPPSEAVAGAIEGLALAKPIEYILRFGEPQADKRAVERFVKRMPLVRHVRLAGIHVVATYDPNFVYGTRPLNETTPPAPGKPREVVIEDFGGVKGRSLKLPADAEVRIFVLEDEGV